VKRRGNLDISSVINELASAENGAVVFSSATGRQYALESLEWGNGAFTKGLVEGLREGELWRERTNHGKHARSLCLRAR